MAGDSLIHSVLLGLYVRTGVGWHWRVASANEREKSASMSGNRKRVKHYHEPSDIHELTFSCYHRLPLLSNDTWRSYLTESIIQACRKQRFCLAAFVFMPEHVHLLVFAETNAPNVSRFLAAVKRPCSASIKRDLVTAQSPLLDTLTVQERPGKMAFRFWQEGPGYDRNLRSEEAVISAIDYFHNNPVRRGLCESAAQWFWSSARFYLTNPREQDPLLPMITRLPSSFFTGTKG